MSNERRAARLEELRKEAERIVAEQNKARKSEQELLDIQSSYAQLFARSDRLFEQLEELFRKSRSKSVFEELFIEAKMDQCHISKRIEDEIDILDAKLEALDERSNRIKAEEQRIFNEMEPGE